MRNNSTLSERQHKKSPSPSHCSIKTSPIPHMQHRKPYILCHCSISRRLSTISRGSTGNPFAMTVNAASENRKLHLSLTQHHTPFIHISMLHQTPIYSLSPQHQNPPPIPPCLSAASKTPPILLTAAFKKHLRSFPLQQQNHSILPFTAASMTLQCSSDDPPLQQL